MSTKDLHDVVDKLILELESFKREYPEGMEVEFAASSLHSRLYHYGIAKVMDISIRDIKNQRRDLDRILRAWKEYQNRGVMPAPMQYEKLAETLNKAFARRAKGENPK